MAPVNGRDWILDEFRQVHKKIEEGFKETCAAISDQRTEVRLLGQRMDQHERSHSSFGSKVWDTTKIGLGALVGGFIAMLPGWLKSNP